MNISIIILNYNGKILLERYLLSIVEAAKKSVHKCTVTVLDNKSIDGSVDFIKKTFPQVKIYQAKENKVYSSFNEVVSEIDEDIVILLNNDMKVDINFIDPLIEHFMENSDILFVATEGDRAIINFRWGIMQPSLEYDGYEALINEKGYTFSAGIGAFDRKKFIELGGFDELYLPGRYEDVDLCFRGWKKGYKGIYEPGAKKYHEGATSFNIKYSSSEISKMVFRNEILFMIKNTTNVFIFLKFVFFLFLRIIFYAITFKFYMIKGFFQALKRLPQALNSRKNAKKNFILKDSEILKTINAEYNNIKKQKPILPKYAKRFVYLLSTQNKLFKNIFFAISFFSIRLFYPLEYFILKELIDERSVLDLGCGSHSVIGILPKNVARVGVDIFEPYIDKANISKRHNHYILADITKVEFENKSFDAVVALDVIEHLQKQQAIELMQKMEKWAKRKIIIVTPNGFFEQGQIDGNAYQEHKSTWDAETLKKIGYKVYGVRGFKALRNCLNSDKEKKNSIFLEKVMDLTQILTYYLPNHAFQLLCIKRLIVKRNEQ